MVNVVELPIVAVEAVMEDALGIVVNVHAELLDAVMFGARLPV